MQITPLSTNSVAAAYAQPVQPQQQQQQQPKPVQKAPATDTVSLSAQALKMASNGETAAKEVQESGAEQSAEKVRGRV